ncbi:hypothetical protein Q6I89_004377 [Salmonella enterica]|nr:hypothetical protein [Salmonella enterica]EJT3914074.1 hypothetical protein [Salmonella enterica]ELL1510016.1 hypothetical protein [Salmonella enterica]
MRVLHAIEHGHLVNEADRIHEHFICAGIDLHRSSEIVFDVSQDAPMSGVRRGSQ